MSIFQPIHPDQLEIERKAYQEEMSRNRKKDLIRERDLRIFSFNRKMTSSTKVKDKIFENLTDASVDLDDLILLLRTELQKSGWTDVVVRRTSRWEFFLNGQSIVIFPRGEK